MTKSIDDEYLVRISYSPGTRRVREEKWYRAGVRDWPSRPNGPAVTRTRMFNPHLNDESEFEVIEYEWRNADPIYRDPSLPNWVVHDLKTGKIVSISWIAEHCVQRAFEKGPAQIEYDVETGNPVFELWIDSYDGIDPPNELFRSFDPVTGVCFSESWHKNGRLHRAGGLPALVTRDPKTGIPVKEEWWINGEPTPHGIQQRERHPKDGLVLGTKFGDASSEVALPDVTDREAVLEAQIAMIGGLRLKCDEPGVKSPHLAL